MADPTALELETLTAARLREVLHYDPDTGMFTRKVARGPYCAGEIAGTTSKKGYVSICIDGKIYKAHRLAWLYMTGKWPMPECDHENRKKSDNRWQNLRAATRQQNTQNLDLRANSKSGRPGVGWHKASGKWLARIGVANRRIHLGVFDTIEAAANAYAAAKANLHKFNPQVP
jgi:hypothetical protein